MSFTALKPPLETRAQSSILGFHVHDSEPNITEVAVVRNSPLASGEVTMRLNIPCKEFMSALNRWKTETNIQSAFPNLTTTEREFLMTGLLPDEQEALFYGS